MIKDKKIFILGASGGVGENIANLFSEHNSEIYLHGTNLKRLEEVSNLILKSNKEIKIFKLAYDLSSNSGLEDLISYLKSNQVQIDILINAAGIFNVTDFIHESSEDFHKAINVNFISPMLISKYLIEGMKKKSWGRIVNITSSSAYAGFPNTVTYCASKHGLLGFSRALHSELRDFGIRVISVAPGSIKTEMGKKVPNQNFDSFIEPEQVAKAIYDLVCLDKNMVIDEVRLNRMKYI